MQEPQPSRGEVTTLGGVLAALSHALDLVEGQPSGHGVRCCWVGVNIGFRAGLSSDQISDLFYVLLLKDLGCSSNAARICELYLTDDIAFKRDASTLNTGSVSQAVRFILNHTGLKASLSDRFRAIVHACQNAGQIVQELVETRCQRGADIARTMRFSDAVADGIAGIDEHWDGLGRPNGLAGTAISAYARIALLSQIVDVFHTSAGRSEAIEEIRRRDGTWFDPDLVAIFEALGEEDWFWEGLTAANLAERIFTLDPAQRRLAIDDDYLDDIARGFAQVIDAKSPYTKGHSERVTLYADMIAEELGISAARRRWLKRAALLHDIGKLGISSAILDKPGKLDDQEWTAIRTHPVHSQAILSRVPAFADLAAIAGGHHSIFMDIPSASSHATVRLPHTGNGVTPS